MTETPFRAPLLIRCEGSGSDKGYCPMCAWVSGIVPVPEHDRLDVLAMIDRGDFDS